MEGHSLCGIMDAYDTSQSIFVSEKRYCVCGEIKIIFYQLQR